MKKSTVAKCVTATLAFAFAASYVSAAPHIGKEYRLKKVVQVEGRQGIAADDKYFYVSDTAGLYKYDRNWKLVKKRVRTKTDGLFPHPELANHFFFIDLDY